ncbi:hypothetical protein EZV62_001441 [Acer yangbiense]|uniref:Retrotransposon Copia-like N-terminal domain-containing protein n=1 Tax=Acer yangbiense TaxID=1000413 RepID=A0A5C7IWI1_9ROSI|nr:hypothetical protein EZV62_001441 [Acer yangbiense]
MALGTIILNLFDNVLREVNEETTAYGVWNKLESLYMTKSLTNKIYLKERLFGFKMDPSKSLGQNLDEFKKMTIELANTGEKEKLNDENEAIILLNSLPESFNDANAAIKYGRSSLSLEECVSALKSKELELKIERKDNGENLFVSGVEPVLEGFNCDGGAWESKSDSAMDPLQNMELIKDKLTNVYPWPKALGSGNAYLWLDSMACTIWWMEVVWWELK